MKSKEIKFLSFTSLMLLMVLKSYTQVDSNDIINIPVVFHVVHGTKSSKCYEKGANRDQDIPRQLILSEMKDLHDDFLLSNNDTSAVIKPYKHLITNPRINFYLDTTINAPQDPGILRVQSNSGNWIVASPLLDTKKYLNVYIVNYDHSYVINNAPWNSKEDCVYLYFCWTGRDYRLLTHETGHWLGLLHLWGTGDGKGDRNSCSTGDYINDTHPQKKATDIPCDYCPGADNETVDQSCDSEPSNYNNYMDYSGCRKMFTKDQVTEMRKNLFQHRSSIVQNSRSKK
jgi:hypothetical protein